MGGDQSARLLHRRVCPSPPDRGSSAPVCTTVRNLVVRVNAT